MCVTTHICKECSFAWPRLYNNSIVLPFYFPLFLTPEAFGFLLREDPQMFPLAQSFAHSMLFLYTRRLVSVLDAIRHIMWANCRVLFSSLRS